MPVDVAVSRGQNATKSGKKAAGSAMSEPAMKQALYALFTESQHHVSSHRKNVHQLRQVHLEWCRGGEAEREEAFFLAFLQCLNVVLAVRRNEEVVGRMLRFVIGFVVFSAEKDDEAAALGSSVTSRFIENLMLYGLEGVDAKEKTVRARLCQLLVACVNSVDELSDHVWEAFRGKMIERLFDREAAVRVHAVHAMARLQALPIGDDDGAGLAVLDIFMDLLQHDPSPEVRRAVLAQIDVTPRSLPVVLARRRDVDARIRRAFFAAKLGELDMRTLSIEQRDAVLRAGLTDRDAGVKQACIDMIFRNWIHDTNSNLVEFLACLDVMANTGMAEGALESFFAGHPGLFGAEGFGGAYLDNLTVETAFILRVYCQWRVKHDGADAAQELLPEMMQMAAYIRRAYESLLTCEPDHSAGGPDPRAEIEFVLQELLLVCAFLDFSDEVGRHVLADALLELLTNLELGDALFSHALQLLIRQAPGPAEYFDVASGLVADFQEVYQAEGGCSDVERSLEALSLADAPLSEEVRILAQLRCLELVREAFRLAHSLEDDALLPHALTDVVIPAVNSAYSVVQSAGLLCLGLGCTLSRELACEYLALLLDFFRLGQDDAALTALRIAFDLLFLFGVPEGRHDALDTLCTALYDPRTSVQAVAAEGFGKLLLHGIVVDQGILEGLLQLAYHAETASEPKLRQCLAYFLPAYAFSRPSHQLALARATLPFLRAYQAAADGLTLGAIVAQLVHFTDSSNLVTGQQHGSEADGPHDVIALDTVWALIEHPAGPMAKPLLGLLSGLRLPVLRPTTVKKLVFLTAQLAKRAATDRVLLSSIKKVLAGLVEVDSVETVICPAELAEIKERLAKHMPASETMAIPVAMARARTSSKKAAAEEAAVENILDDLDDILQ